MSETMNRILACHPFIIAEIGVNHDGSVERAIELVGMAKTAGADAVKLQIFTADALMNRDARFAAYQQANCEDVDPAAMLRRYELPADDVARLVSCIKAAGMVPVATPFSLPDVGTIKRLDFPVVKIASPDLVNTPLLRAVSELRRPMLVSTGAATMEEVGDTARMLRAWEAEVCLLHCVSSYPTPMDQLHLSWIGELKELGFPAGYSDHSTMVISGALATAAGAQVLERHLTYDKRAAGPDHAASSDPAEFAEYARLARDAAVMMGAPGKRVLEIEGDVRTVSRQSVVLGRDVQAGEKLTASDLIIQRPGTGIPARDFDRVIGQVMKEDGFTGRMLNWNMLE